ncbi:MAG: hypothetical protein KJ967_05705 [Elusimicrobia bacterium]|nr:hypothetical protein [Elusimicrobiota bacterium]
MVKIFLIITLCLFTNSGFLWAGWNVQTVDSAGYVGHYTSIALDTNNYPHISYLDFTNLKYAKWTGSSWNVQTVDSGGYGGCATSIALDTNNEPHISYRYETNDDLKYAKWTGTSWSIQTVDSAGSVGMWTSIALDTNNYPHISYRDSTNYDLKYAKWTGASWSIQTVDKAGDVGDFTSIALDTNNYPHISHRASTNSDLKYAKEYFTDMDKQKIADKTVEKSTDELFRDYCDEIGAKNWAGVLTWDEGSKISMERSKGKIVKVDGYITSVNPYNKSTEFGLYYVDEYTNAMQNFVCRVSEKLTKNNFFDSNGRQYRVFVTGKIIGYTTVLTRIGTKLPAPIIDVKAMVIGYRFIKNRITEPHKSNQKGKGRMFLGDKEIKDIRELFEDVP